MKTTCLFKLSFLLLLAGAAHTSHAQGVGIGTTTPDASAALEIKTNSTTPQGFLPPRLNQADRNQLANPAVGLTIFNTTTGLVNTWDGAQWAVSLTNTANLAPVTFYYTGGPQTYIVPANVTSLAIDMLGASGGTGGYLGGRVQATLAVSPGQLLTLYVGGTGLPNAGGYNGGGNGYKSINSSAYCGFGGGGATDIRLGGTALTNRVLVAGGGAGNGEISTRGGAGGGLTGGKGTDDNFSISTTSTGGGGGGSSAAGAGGASAASTSGSPVTNGTAGVDGTGGTGGMSMQGSIVYGGGGGGGGYFGGGGGGGGAGGGGGSSYAGSGTSAVTHTQGSGGVRYGYNSNYYTGDGYIHISPILPNALPAPFLNAANFTNLALSLSGQNLSITGGNTVTLPPGADNLGNHTAAQNLDLATYQLVGNGGSQGISISNGGNVGIGTNAPLGRFMVAGGSVLLATGLMNSATRPVLNINRSPGEVAALGQADNTTPGLSYDDGFLRLSAGGGTHVNTRSYIDLTGYSNLISGSSPDYDMYQNIVLGTSGVERLRIVAGGNIGIGTSTPGTLLDVNGAMRCASLTQTSDARLKQNIRPLSSALTTVQALHGVRYTFRQAEFRDRHLPSGEQIGVLAQELEQVLPELVSTDAQGYKSVNYAQLTPVLIEALKEQQRQIEDLRQEVNTIKANTVRTEARAEQIDTDHASLLTLQAQLARLLGEGAQAHK